MPSRGKFIGKRMEYGTLRFHSRYADGDLARGKTEARLALLAMRRVQLRIDRELKHVARQLTS